MSAIQVSATTKKPLLAFIDHSFHLASGSSRFFIEVLEAEYSVTVFYDRRWEGKDGVDVDKIVRGGFETIVYWQSLGTLHDLIRLRRMNVVWVPMFDEVDEHPPVFWTLVGALGLKVICFSEALHARLSGRRIESVVVRYFPEPSPMSVAYDGVRVFLWQRCTEIAWPLVRNLISGAPIVEVVIKNDPDLGERFVPPPASDVELFNIRVVDDVKISEKTSTEAYQRMLFRCNVFIAPRLREGIGLSVLEAMATGMCVIAHDAPTMNEYIKSGDTGYLWSGPNPEPVDLMKFEEVGRRAQNNVREGHKHWLASLAALRKFIAIPAARRTIKPSLVGAVVGYSAWRLFRLFLRGRIARRAGTHG